MAVPTVARRVGPAATAAIGLCGCALLWVADPREADGYPACPFYSLTGRFCPGCGTLRGLGRLVHGDVAGAIGFNVLMVLTLPVLVAAWASWAFPTAVGRRLPRLTQLPASWIMAFFAATVAFWVTRNLSFDPWQALAP